MSTYCIADIHGCYDELCELLQTIAFDGELDTIYVLGDAMDRGPRPLDCLNLIRKTKGMRYIFGNHDRLLLNFFDRLPESAERWRRNGSHQTLAQLAKCTEKQIESTINYLRKRPLWRTATVNGRRFFLSHAGLEPGVPFVRQTERALTWSREGFYNFRAKEGYVCVFGHTGTLHMNADKSDCSVWFDEGFRDKVCIDCSCVYGGALAALRLDDGAVFYAKSRQPSERALTFAKKSIPF